MKIRSSGPLAAFSGQFFLIFILPLTVLILVVAFGSQSLHHDAMRSLVGDRDLRVARAAAGALNQELDSRLVILELLASTIVDEQHLPDIRSQSIFERGLLHLAGDGTVLFSFPANLIWAASASQRVRQTADQPSVFTFSPNLAVIFVPHPQGGWLLGGFDPEPVIEQTLATFVDPDRTSFRVASLSRDTASEIWTLYQVGPGLADAALPHHPGLAEALAGQSGMTYVPSDHGEHVVAYAPVELSDWALIAEEEWETIASPWLRNTQLAPLVLAPALLLALIALWYAARKIIQPLRELEQRTSALSRGEFGAIREPVGGIPEIQNLQAGLAEMSEKLAAAQHSLRSYIGAITLGVENERRSLARELHDDTIQALIALNQRIQLAARSEIDPSQKERLLELQAMLQQAMANLRRMVRGLRPIYLEDLGLSTALEMLVQETHQQSGMQISFQRQGREIRLDAAQEVSIYRIVQEALSNIIHHSAASQASVRLDYGESQLEVLVNDDGRGFIVPENMNEFAARDHFGLVGLYERTEGMNARMQIISSPGQGTTIHLILPIQNPLK